MDWTHRHTIVLSLNSVYGLNTPSHHCTEFEQCIWTVHTVTPLYWVWTVYMDCTHRHTIVRPYYFFRSARTFPYPVWNRIMNCFTRLNVDIHCFKFVGSLQVISHALQRRARLCFCVYSAYTVTLHFPCWLSIVKGIRSLPYFQKAVLRITRIMQLWMDKLQLRMFCSSDRWKNLMLGF